MTTKQALSGLRIVDLSWFGAGPSVSRDLALYGAEVIKIESMARMDAMRVLHPSAPGPAGSVNLGGWFNNANCGKLSALLNLRHPEAKRLLLELVSVSDAVIENFAYPTLERLGLGPDVLFEANPTLVMLRLTPMGVTGPKAHWSGYGYTMVAIAGLTHLIGPEGRPPTGYAVTFGDTVSSPGHGAVSLLAALMHRRRTGRGQVIDLSQVEAAAALLGGVLLDYTVNGRVQQRTGNRSPWASPHNVYRCLGDDRWCAIAVWREEQWRALGLAMGRPEWAADPKFETFAGRKRHEDELDRLIEGWTSSREPNDAMETLQRAGVPAAAVRTPHDVLFEDAQLRHREHFAWLPHPETPEMLYDGPVFRLSKPAKADLRRAPLIGEHNDYVFQDLLGMTEEKTAVLIVDEAIH